MNIWLSWGENSQLLSNEFINSHILRKLSRNPEQNDHVEILKLVSWDWPDKIRNKIAIQNQIKSKYLQSNLIGMKSLLTKHSEKIYIVPQTKGIQYCCFYDGNMSHGSSKTKHRDLHKEKHSTHRVRIYTLRNSLQLR